ncbi:hypothetical protein CIHG_02705 [Coccidioides immitis H538.4]|uniref:Uncharacterized protein n=2 Tax=Coccidioides immitis TaxID=5501 RepID=A0A0J8QN43_COCIT|nr:hypothetical protein CISG_03859 [Coccidioides immitis RMSCC 3703]KMU84922.1 hypothetical protein CIHG_02705 [Coccidioides immitis H538.4]
MGLDRRAARWAVDRVWPGAGAVRNPGLVSVARKSPFSRPSPSLHFLAAEFLFRLFIHSMPGPLYPRTAPLASTPGSGRRSRSDFLAPATTPELPSSYWTKTFKPKVQGLRRGRHSTPITGLSASYVTWLPNRCTADTAGPFPRARLKDKGPGPQFRDELPSH